MTPSQQSGGAREVIAGQFAGDLVLVPGRAVEIVGQVTGSLVIAPHASPVIRGQIAGDVLSDGQVDVYGMIAGRLIDRSGTAYVAPGAVIVGG